MLFRSVSQSRYGSVKIAFVAVSKSSLSLIFSDGSIPTNLDKSETFLPSNALAVLSILAFSFCSAESVLSFSILCCSALQSPSPLPVWGVGDDSLGLPNISSTAFTNSGLLPSCLALW